MLLRKNFGALWLVLNLGRTALLVALLIAMTSPFASGRPNIVFILADDLGWTDTSVAAVANGRPSDFYETPRLEELAAKGMTFPCAYSAGANCAPTRAALLTGQYGARPTNNVFAVGNLNRAGGATPPLVGPANGLPTGEDQIPGRAVTIAETLRTAGYSTAFFGKYHVGQAPGGALGNSPLDQGFERNFGGSGAGNPGGTYFANRRGEFASAGVGPELDAYASPGEHLTDATTDAAIEYMADHAGAPFFVLLSYHAVHSPIRGQGRADLAGKYRAKPAGRRHSNPDYAALVEGLDEGVGRVLDFLRSTQDTLHPGQMLEANTLVVFTSDNGGLEARGVTDNGPLKGQKGEYSEGGIRVPLIVAQPGVIPAGTVNDTPVSTIDFYPTLAAAGEAEPPAEVVLDGENLLPILIDVNATLARTSLYWHFPGYLIDSTRQQRPQSIIRAVRGSESWKLLYNYEDASWELYELDADLGETSNLASSRTDIVAELGGELASWLEEVGAPLPNDAATGAPAPMPRQHSNRQQD